MSSVEPRVAKATVREPSVLEALEEAEDEHGSLAAAVRHAIATTYAMSDDETSRKENTGLPVKAMEGYRKLLEWTGIGGRIELDTAESILANHLNIQKEAVRKVVIYPLKTENVIRIHQGIHQVSIVVGVIGGTDEIAPPEQTEPETATATDGGEVRAELDELAAAGKEVADGN